MKRNLDTSKLILSSGFLTLICYPRALGFHSNERRLYIIIRSICGDHKHWFYMTFSVVRSLLKTKSQAARDEHDQPAGAGTVYDLPARSLSAVSSVGVCPEIFLLVQYGSIDKKRSFWPRLKTCSRVMLYSPQYFCVFLFVF